MSQTQPLKSVRVERGIYFVNYPNNKGIRVFLQHKDKTFQKVFPVKSSIEEMLQIARDWKDAKEDELLFSGDYTPLKRKQKNNKTGISGVRESAISFHATWTDNGIQYHRSFGKEKFGSTSAFLQACNARAEAEIQMWGEIKQSDLKTINDAFHVLKDTISNIK